ncbi:secretion system protein [Lampropedia puyangensis]|uniref:Secretion system protein n=1 Tax=Lampropedia puyangensis TaxID=1330072 RepID=A0A4V4GR16_9BURK|nr:type II secretion system F family protein [Lampropedia puyangensis]THT99965.1 secretion system protein [Lampropedia puyangensis]
MSTLVPAVLLIVALAVILLALALWLFAQTRQKEQQQSVHRHLQQSLGRHTTASPSAAAFPGQPALAATAHSPFAHYPLTRWLDERFGMAAWGIHPRTLLILAITGLFLTVLAGAQAGLLASLLALACYSMLVSFLIWQRISKRRRKLVQQLPSFLDNMVRLITIGNSPHAAFQLAVLNVPEPLGEALEQANAMLSANPDLGNAMAQLERGWRLPEFGLLAAVFRMSVRYGGRADLVLERVCAYIRDRQAAERELHALSAEIRLSAWVLALLPIVVGGLIMVLNAGYFLQMWRDPSGQNMILLAAGLEAFGAFLLYRLARLK